MNRLDGLEETYETINARTRAIDEPAEERLAFIRKVYSLFFFALLFAGLGAFLGIRYQLVLWILKHPWISLFLIIGGMFLVQGVRLVPGINLLALFGFATLEGIYTGALIMVAAYFTGSFDVVWQALILTGLVFSGLTLFVFSTKRDFSMWGGFLFVGLLTFTGLIILNIFFFQSTTMTMVISGGIVLLIAGFVLVDTSLIMRRYSTNEYIAATLSLFIDFIIMFWYILQILMSFNRR
jgi:hypothetical protein